MGIKPALGWLGLLLFATAAQAEPKAPARWARAVLAERQKPESAPTVTPRTKAPPAPRSGLAVVDANRSVRADYEADGHVLMVFERQRRDGFRISKDAIKSLVRMTGGVDPIDVIETTGGAVVVDTSGRGSDVYVFARETTPTQRVAALEAIPTRARERVRDALATAAKY